MNDRLNAPLEPRDDGSVQDEPLYQEPSEGIVTDSGHGDVPQPGKDEPGGLR